MLNKKGKMIDVLAIAKNDWANSMYRYCRSLMSLGLHVVAIKGERHVFGYPEQVPLHPSLFGTPINKYPVTVMAPHLESLMDSAHVIHLFASTFPLLSFDWSKANVVVQHGGTTYRLEPEKSNNVFNQFAKATIIQCPDLLGLGANNEHLIYYPVDTDKIQPNYKRRHAQKIIIGHFPSDPAVKGTSTILAALANLEKDPELASQFQYVGITNVMGGLHWANWEDNLKRLAMCDIVIETCNPVNYGKKFGEWGNTALEASALGCIVVTNSLTTDLYKREYGGCALNIANDQAQLETTLRKLVSLSDDELEQQKMQSRIWVEKHNIEQTGKRLWDKVYHPFFF